MEIAVAAKCLAELGAPLRLEAFRLLVKAGPEGLTVSDVKRHLNIPASTLSHHIARLVWCGLVKQTREGRVLRCRIEYQRVSDLLAFLQKDCCAGLAVHAAAAPPA